MIFERTWLALVGVARDVLRVRRFLVDELPLHAGWEAGAAAAAQARGLHELDHLIGRHCERFLQPFVAFVLQIEVERETIGLPHVLGKKRLQGYLLSITW